MCEAVEVVGSGLSWWWVEMDAQWRRIASVMVAGVSAGSGVSLIDEDAAAADKVVVVEEVVLTGGASASGAINWVSISKIVDEDCC